MEKIIRRETVRVERVTFKIPILSCGHKYRPIVGNQPVRKYYFCFSCTRKIKRDKEKAEKKGEIFIE